MSQPRSLGLGAVLILISSLVALAVALYAYFTPLTGVNGSIGALAVVLGCALLAILALFLTRASSRGARITLRIVVLIGLVGIGVAALLLHQWWITAAMVVGLVGLMLDLARPTTHRPAHA